MKRDTNRQRSLQRRQGGATGYTYLVVHGEGTRALDQAIGVPKIEVIAPHRPL